MYFEIFCTERNLQNHHFCLYLKITVSAFELLDEETRTSICVMTERFLYNVQNENSLQT